MKVGDLVTPQFWCKDTGRLAIVVTESTGEIIIQYLDDPRERTYARRVNLELISEAKT